MLTQVIGVSSWNQYLRVLRPLADYSLKQQVTSLAELKYLKLPEGAEQVYVFRVFFQSLNDVGCQAL